MDSSKEVFFHISLLTAKDIIYIYKELTLLN